MNDNIFVSIVMTYFDRLSQLNLTLQSFKTLSYTNFEVIIIDDVSVNEPIFDYLFDDIGFPVKVIKMPLVKDYTNPSIPYNAGFLVAKGEIIIIQNSECLHIGNVLHHARMNVDETNYISYACISLSKAKTFEIIDKPYLYEQLLNSEANVYNTLSDFGEISWKNHSKYRPNALHFTSAITKINMDRLGGFDQRYAIGTSFDDDEFLRRIARIPLKIEIEDDVVVVHQWHSNPSANVNKFRIHYLQLRNQFLYHFVTLKETTYSVSNNSFPYLFYRIYSPLIIYPIAFLKSVFGTIKRLTKFQKV